MKNITLISLLTLAMGLSACSKTVELINPNGPSNGSGPGPSDFELSKNPQSGSASDKFQKTPDNTKVVYIADEDIAGKNELYVLNLEGGQKVKISPSLISNGDVISFVISPNSQKVAFLADVDNDERIDLYTVNLDGTSLAKVNAGVPTTAHKVADTYKFMPNSLKLAFVTDEASTAGNNSLYVANLDGSARTKLNVNAPGDGRVNTKFEVTSLGRLVYPSISTGSGGEWIMNSVLSDQSSYKRLSVLTGQGNRSVQQDSFVVSPNGLKVVYLSTADDEDVTELHSIDVDASYPSTHNKISGTLVADGNVFGFADIPFQITSDSSKVLFVADGSVFTKLELYSVGITGTGLTKINSTLPANGDIKGFKVGSNSQDVVYLADGDSDEVFELYYTNLTLGGVNKVNTSLVAAEDVLDFEIDSASSRVLYVSNKGSNTQLYTNVFSGSSEVSISGISLVPMYDVISPKTSQMVVSGGRVFFRNALEDSTLDLYSANVNGTDLKRSHSMDHAGDVLLADSATGNNYVVVNNYVVYRVNQTGHKTLYSSKF